MHELCGHNVDNMWITFPKIRRCSRLIKIPLYIYHYYFVRFIYNQYAVWEVKWEFEFKMGV
jgi:hypothetical protein